MKIIRLSLILLSLIYSMPLWCRISEDSDFDIYEIGNFEPNSVDEFGRVGGNDPVSHRGAFAYWRDSVVGDGRVQPVFRSLSVPLTTHETTSPEFFPGSNSQLNGFLEGHFHLANALDVDLGNFSLPIMFGSIDVSLQGTRGFASLDTSSPPRIFPTFGGRWSRVKDVSYGAYSWSTMTLEPYTIVGEAEDEQGRSRIFWTKSDHIADLYPAISIYNLVPDIESTEAVDMDEYGHFVIGTYRTRSHSESRRSFYMEFVERIDNSYSPIRTPGIHSVDLGGLGGQETVATATQYLDTAPDEGPSGDILHAFEIIGWSHDSMQRKKAFICTLFRSVYDASRDIYPVLNARMISLGTLSGQKNAESAALALSKNGEIVGWSSDPTEPLTRAFVYLPERGMIDLNHMLRQSSDTESWRLLRATAISENGNYIVGKGLFTPTTSVLMKGRWVRVPTGSTQERAFIMVRNTGTEGELKRISNSLFKRP